MSANGSIREIRTSAPQLNCTVVHDYFMQAGGAERVALELSKLCAQPILTSFVNKESSFQNLSEFHVQEALSSRYLRRSDPRLVFSLMPFALKEMARQRFVGTVVASSSGWVHRLAARIDNPVVTYMHTPARWLYVQDEYFSGSMARMRSPISAALMPSVRSDMRDSRAVHTFIANSTTVRDRIRRVYRRDSHVIHPPVSIDVLGNTEQIPALKDVDFFLTVSRPRGYKNTGLAMEGFSQMRDSKLVVVGLDKRTDVPSNCVPVGRVSDAELRWLYQRARGIVALSFEDFGLTPIEGHFYGKPTIALRRGGYLDTCIEGVNATFVDSPTSDNLIRARREFDDVTWDSAEIARTATRFNRDDFLDQVGDVVAGVR